MALNNNRINDLNEEVLTKMNQAKFNQKMFPLFLGIIFLVENQTTTRKMCWIEAKMLYSLYFGGSKHNRERMFLFYF